MQPQTHSSLESAFYIIRTPPNLPGRLGLLREASREDAEESGSAAGDANYFQDRAETHERMALESKHPAARAVHLELAERYRGRVLEADHEELFNWVNEGGSWQ